MILSCGEALIDMLPRETLAGEAAFVPYAGGAVFNTAIALGRLGAPSGFFTGLSTDLFGQILDRTLAASGVDTTLCARSDRPTTLAFVTLVNGQATYAFYDENTAGRLLSTADLPALPASIDTLFFGGISLVNDPAATAYETLQARAGAAGRVTMIDRWSSSPKGPKARAPLPQPRTGSLPQPLSPWPIRSARATPSTRAFWPRCMTGAV